MYEKWYEFQTLMPEKQKRAQTNFFRKKLYKRIFLDYASTTPVLPEVARIMRPFFSVHFANPSAIYEEGVEAKKVLDSSRKKMAGILHAHADEIIFTGSGTEADNLAIFGVLESAKKIIHKRHIIISPFEHPAILMATEIFQKNGGEVSYLPMYPDGRVHVEDVKKALTANTILVSVMYANNEIGTIQPIRKIAKEIRHFKNLKLKSKNLPYFHTDASQAANYCTLNVATLGVDLMTLDASKIYGPKGIGLLYARRGINLAPRIVGGGQESGLRSGTENIPLIVGFAEALQVAERDSEQESKRLTEIRDKAIRLIQKKISRSHLNGSLENRLPNNINICFPGIDSELVVLRLDARGFSVSSSSSCRNLSDNTRSYVIASLGEKNCDESSLRITLGRDTEEKDLLAFIKILAGFLK